MAENTSVLERVSKVLGVPPKELVRKGLEGLLEAQLRICFAEINEIKTRYSIKTGEELERKIGNGSIVEHPGWEDLILLENLEDRIKNIRKELTALGQTTIPAKTRKKFRIEEGTKLKLIETDDSIILKPKKSFWEMLGAYSEFGTPEEVKKELDKLGHQESNS